MYFLSTAWILVPAILSFNHVLGQNCPCGFVDSNRRVWRESIVSTFTQPIGPLPAVAADWNIASDSGVQKPTGFKMQYVASNVFAFNDGLGLQTSAYTGDGTIRTAEIDTKRGDILYGTFRMRAQIPSVPGVVFGFFTYKGDSQEQDIEFVSADPNYSQTVHYTNQPGTTVIINADLTEFSNHRLDWIPGQTLYYFNNTLQTTISKNVPVTPSNVILNVWSNGDP
ncbi:glycoside hydrolase family 16 protein, partial [Ramaria rubella]